jgi:hyaluronan synthase
MAAYRSSAVLIVARWINQKFMGRSSDIGEDRAMTNMIFKTRTKKVLFQRNAIVLTDVPEKYKVI